jgi:hypothetical protein
MNIVFIVAHSEMKTNVHILKTLSSLVMEHNGITQPKEILDYQTQKMSQIPQEDSKEFGEELKSSMIITGDNFVMTILL